jgi:hypothetical protein
MKLVSMWLVISSFLDNISFLSCQCRTKRVIIVQAHETLFSTLSEEWENYRKDPWFTCSCPHFHPTHKWNTDLSPGEVSQVTFPFTFAHSLVKASFFPLYTSISSSTQPKVNAIQTLQHDHLYSETDRFKWGFWKFSLQKIHLRIDK